MASGLDAAAARFFDNSANRGHSERSDVTDPRVALASGLVSGRETAARSLRLVQGGDLRVLDVGCSWGPITIGGAESSRVARMVGIDSELQALALGRAVSTSDLMSSSAAAEKLDFVRAAAEQLPFDSGRFDLVICHTVIEHVGNVEAALAEMLRVLRPGGVLHLEAPNYLWPREPHLSLWMPPLGPKWLVKQLARLTGKNAAFVDHLMFVNPYWIERALRRAGAQYENIYLRKLERIVVHRQFEEVVAMRRAIPVLRLLHRCGADRLVLRVASGLGMYPSIEYAISK